MTDPLQLVPGPTDAERAADFRARVAPHLAAIADLMTEASRSGYHITWNVGADPTGRWHVQQVFINKSL